MTNCYPKPALLLTVLGTLAVFMVQGVSVSTVRVTNKDEVPLSAEKSLGMINIPQVPEFPKFAARPGKTPTAVASAPVTTNNQVTSQQYQPQQPQQHQPQQPQQPQQTVQSSQQTQTYSHPVQNLISSFGLPPAVVPYLSTAAAYDSDQEAFETEHEVEEDNREDNEDSNYNDSSHDTTLFHSSYEPIIATINDSSTNKHANGGLPAQEVSAEFPMPPHVIHILNALGGTGTGGSLAQATKPEKDGSLHGQGQGYTTANAIGYATGDNATVTAAVSNKMELNTSTVVLTESASASASSNTNGTAFSQATLSSNGYVNQWKGGHKNLSKFT